MQMQLTLIATSPKEVKYLSGLLEMISNTDAAASMTTVVETKALPAKKAKAVKEEPKAKKKKAPVEVDDDEDEELDDDDEDDADDDTDDSDSDTDDTDTDDDSDDDEEEEDEEPAPPKKGRGRPPGTPAKAAAAPAAKKGSSKLKLDDVIDAFSELAETKTGRGKGAKMLADFGVKAVRDLKEPQWADALKKINKLKA